MNFYTLLELAQVLPASEPVLQQRSALERLQRNVSDLRRVPRPWDNKQQDVAAELLRQRDAAVTTWKQAAEEPLRSLVDKWNRNET